jgi:carbon storage regulator CsrA
MLVLSRKKDESIIIRTPDKEIVLTVVRVDNLNKVRLGIEAEDDVVILRSELDSVNRPITRVATPKSGKFQIR